MKKLLMLVLGVFMVLSGCGKANADSLNETSFEVKYDYGLHITDKAAMLLNDSTLFFNLDDYNIDSLVAGDIVKVKHTGEAYLLLTYPSHVTFKDGEVKSIEVVEAEVQQFKMENRQLYDVYGVKITTTDLDYIINEDGSYKEVDKEYGYSLLYASYVMEGDEVKVKGLYSYNPRG